MKHKGRLSRWITEMFLSVAAPVSPDDNQMEEGKVGPNSLSYRPPTSTHAQHLEQCIALSLSILLHVAPKPSQLCPNGTHRVHLRLRLTARTPPSTIMANQPLT